MSRWITSCQNPEKMCRNLDDKGPVGTWDGTLTNADAQFVVIAIRKVTEVEKTLHTVYSTLENISILAQYHQK